MDGKIAQTGHNGPPADEDILRQSLLETNGDLVSRVDALMDSMTRTPEVVDASNAGAVGDFIKQLTGANKESDSRRKATKEPYLAGGRTVDGFFKSLDSKLLDAKKKMENRLDVHLRAVAEAERKQREEEARLQREEAARLQREADEKAASLATETDLDTAVAAEETATQANADAVQAEKSASANAADMSRTRGDYGSVSSLRTFRTFDEKSVKRESLDLETLRDHLPAAALEQAIRSFIKAGGHTLKGVHIFEDTKTVVR